MEINSDEIRLKPEEAVAILASCAPLRSNEFIDAVLRKIEEQLPAVLDGSLSNFYVSVEVYDY